ncbi:unnamed protein product [Symbiodinium sp. CCMP2592]|nr:unnamed protein product [Symbiodinium sp. CCMP2592]
MRPVQMHIYTDGSACERTSRSGYAVILLMKIGAACAIFGILGGPLEGADSCAWSLEQLAALHAEQVAVAAALLWLLQLRCFIPRIEALMFVDCLAAGRAATGQWAPPNELAQRSHSLELILREIEGVTLQIQHIKGHAGHGWNEVADAVAKSAAKGESLPFSPPSHTIRTFMTANLEWISFDMAARRTGSSWMDENCMCWPEQYGTTFRLSPQQLVPTVAEDEGLWPIVEADGSEFVLSACSFNVQGLGSAHRYMEEQFDFYGYNVAFLQETKSNEGQCSSRRFYRLMSPAERHWGVAVWVSRQRGLMSINGKPIFPSEENSKVLFTGPRLLAVQFDVQGFKVGMIAGHCPHAGRAKERDAFVTDLREVLSRMKRWPFVLLGLDANARFPNNVLHVTGELVVDEPDANGVILTEVCRDLGLWAPATFGHLHRGESATYTHCTGDESRIDYFLLGGGATISACHSAVNAELDNGSPNVDHKAITVSVAGRMGKGAVRARLKRVKYDTEAMATEKGKLAVQTMCSQFEQPRWDTSPDEHCHLIEAHLQHFMSDHFSKTEGPERASYIPEEVWRLRQMKNLLKWRTRERLQGWQRLLPIALQVWCGGGDQCLLPRLRKQTVMYQLVAAAVKFVTHRMRKMIAEAKDGFLRRVAAEGDQGVCAILNRAKRAGIGARARAPVRRDLPKLLDPTTGRQAETVADRDDIWLRFFGEQEAGRIMGTQDFIEEASVGLGEESPDWDWHLLPSRLDIEKALRRLPKGKAAGLDQVPSDLLRVCPSGFAALLQPLYVKSLVLGRQPLQWRGGVLFEMFKQSGAQPEVANHRSIYISSFLAKTLHRVMRDKVKDETEAFLHPLHCGTRPGLPVLFPSLFVLEHLRKCQQTGLCSALLFVDTKAAYYRLVRQLATGDLRVGQKIEALFHRFGLDGSDIEALSELILSGGMFKAANIPDPIRAAAADFHRATCEGQRLYSNQEAIPIVPHYKHLGCMVDPTARLLQEARHRTALAATAYDSAKDLLLQNRDLVLTTRVALFRTTVVATYFNLGVWLTHGPAWRHMSDAFSRLVRRLLCRLVPEKEVYKIPTPLAHVITGCWPLEQFARRDRIFALVSLAATGPPILWAAIQTAGQWAEQLCDDLRWLVAGDQSNWPSVCAAAWPQWWHLLRDHPERVKRRAAKRNEETFGQYKSQAIVDLCLWYLFRSLRPEPVGASDNGSWWCRVCDKMFRSRANLSVHFFKAHGRCAEYRRYIDSTVCGACGKEKLQRTRRPSSALAPGYGSKRRRQREAETFTPAPPTAPTTSVAWVEKPWSTCQVQLHSDLCDVVLDAPPSADFEDELWRRVCKYPLYTEEIQQVVHYLVEEMDLVAQDRDLQQWTSQQLDTLLSALQQVLAKEPPHADETQRGSETLHSRASFTKAAQDLDWLGAISRQCADYVTQDSTLYTLTEDWEVVWSQNRGVEFDATVIRDPLRLLPRTLWMLWKDFLNEGSPELEAPPSFWSHPLAAAFLPFRVQCAVN